MNKDQELIKRAMIKMGFINENDFIFFIKKYCLLQNLEKKYEIEKIINSIDDMQIIKEIQKIIKERIKELNEK
jgi:hypothetical protein